MKILYIDGGGTKTAAYFTENNKLIDCKTTDAANINTNFDQSMINIEYLVKQFNSYEKIIMGLAGTKFDLNKEKELVDYFKEKYCNDVELYSDLELIAMLAIQPKNEKSLLINLGTGTAAIYYDLENYNTILGWGRIIGDIGSGYDIGISFIQYLTRCEDIGDKNEIYNKFLKDFNISNMREYGKEVSNVTGVTRISKWISEQSLEMTEKFILTRVKKALDYLSFIDVNNIFLTGSILIKNDVVREFVKKYYQNKNIKFVEFSDCFLKI